MDRPGQMLKLMALCSLKAAAGAAGILAILDIFAVRILFDLLPMIAGGVPAGGMGAAFHIISIMTGLLIAVCAGGVVGPVWALVTARSGNGVKARAMFVWVSLLAFLALAYISANSVEVEMTSRDLTNLKAEEVERGRLRVTGRLLSNLYGVERVEEVERRHESGFWQIVLLVHGKAADGGRRLATFDHTMDLPDHVKRVTVGDDGDEGLVWGRTAEELLSDMESDSAKLNLTNLEYLGPGGDEGADDERVRDLDLLEEIRRIYLGNREPGDRFLDQYRTKISTRHRAYTDRISGKIKSMRARYADGTSIIIDRERDPSLMEGTNLIICEADGTMKLCGLSAERGRGSP